MGNFQKEMAVLQPREPGHRALRGSAASTSAPGVVSWGSLSLAAEAGLPGDRVPLCRSVFMPCHAVIPPRAYYEGCTFDHCHMTDADVVCSGLELYASLCASHGVCIDWRGRTNHTCRECPPRASWRRRKRKRVDPRAKHTGPGVQGWGVRGWLPGFRPQQVSPLSQSLGLRCGFSLHSLHLPR